MRSCDLIRPSFRWLLLAIKDVVFRVSFVCFGSVLGSLGSHVLRCFVYEGVVTFLTRFCEAMRNGAPWSVWADVSFVCCRLPSWRTKSKLACPTWHRRRRQLRRRLVAGCHCSLVQYRIPLKRPLQCSDQADSSSDSNLSWLDSDSDGESGPSVGRQAGLVGADGYRRFDALAKEWQFLATSRGHGGLLGGTSVCPFRQCSAQNHQRGCSCPSAGAVSLGLVLGGRQVWWGQISASHSNSWGSAGGPNLILSNCFHNWPSGPITAAGLIIFLQKYLYTYISRFNLLVD